MLPAAFGLVQSSGAGITGTGGVTQPDLGKLPLQFEANRGQAVTEVQYMARTGDNALFFTPGEVALALQGTEAGVRLQFVGANPSHAITSGAELPGKVNYLVGNDPAQWRTGVPVFGDIRYAGLYNGIDLKYEGTGGQLKGTYTVAPNTDPAAIQWRYSGAQSLAVAGNGDLNITLSANSTLVESAPVSWQDIGGTRVPVASSYKLAGDTVSFALGSYNPAYPLTIDPAIEFGTFLGTTGTDEGLGVGVDGSGNIYMAGTSRTSGLPLVNSLYNYSGAVDWFVAKFSSDGSQLLYSTYIGGTFDDFARDMEVDVDGNVYVTGSATSANFPITPNAYDNINTGGDAALIKLSPSGQQLLYSTFLGGSLHERAYGVDADDVGNAVITGETSSENFPIRNAFQDLNFGNMDMFVTKIDTEASGDASLIFSTYLGGSGTEPYSATHGNIALDGSGNVMVVGTTMSNDFPTTKFAYDTSFGGGGNSDAVISKFASDGSIVYSTYLGGTGSETAYTVASDAAGNAHVVGITSSQGGFPTTDGAYNRNCVSGTIFATKFNELGGDLVYSTCVHRGAPFAAEVTALGELYVTGNTRSDIFPMVNPIQSIYRAFEDTIVFKLNAAGGRLLFSTYLTGSGGDGGSNALSKGSDLALDGNDHVYVSGTTNSVDFPTTNPLYQYRGNDDAYLLKLFVEPGDTCEAIQFTDVPTTHTFYPYVNCLACRLIIGGYADGTFRAENNVTRGQLAKIVSGAAGYNEPVTGQTFSDVPPTHSFYIYIERAAAHGVIGGYTDGTFRPQNNATRGQIAKIISNAAGYNEPVSGQRFIDVPPTHPFYEFVERIAGRGIISGYADGTFRPENNATRGQTSKIVSNTFFPECTP
jgi:hypothetical protein